MTTHRVSAPGPRLSSRFSDDVVRHLITTAGRAPSLHNSQPWRFRHDGEELELLIDPQRALRVSDPAARELVLACGAALYNLRIALRCEGLVPHVDLTPASGDPLLLARITAKPGPDPTADELRLLGAVAHRHTHRHGFAQRPLSGTLVAALEADVAAEGARLVWIDAPQQVRAVAELALQAGERQSADPDWQAEIARWVDDETGTGRRDGIPTTALPDAPPHPGTDRLPPRQFGVNVPRGASSPNGAGRIAVLVTPQDGLIDWVAAGQSLQRMLLRGTLDWVFARYATAPLEVPDLRQALRDTLELRDHPQMMLELGHAGFTRPTPRLPADEQLDR